MIAWKNMTNLRKTGLEQCIFAHSNY